MFILNMEYICLHLVIFKLHTQKGTLDIFRLLHLICKWLPETACHMGISMFALSQRDVGYCVSND